MPLRICYPTVDAAKKAAEEDIRASVETWKNGEWHSEKTYEEICAAGGGIQGVWGETELEDGLALSYKMGPNDNHPYEMVIIPIPHVTVSENAENIEGCPLAATQG